MLVVGSESSLPKKRMQSIDKDVIAVIKFSVGRGHWLGPLVEPLEPAS